MYILHYLLSGHYLCNLFIGEDDLHFIDDAVNPRLAAQSLSVGSHLGLSPSFLEGVKQSSCDPEERLRMILTEWLRWNYDHKTHGLPSWRRLVQAVDKRNHWLAMKMARQHKGKIYLQVCIMVHCSIIILCSLCI